MLIYPATYTSHGDPGRKITDGDKCLQLRKLGGGERKEDGERWRREKGGWGERERGERGMDKGIEEEEE